MTETIFLEAPTIKIVGIKVYSTYIRLGLACFALYAFFSSVVGLDQIKQ